jgi:hypothetical protein
MKISRFCSKLALLCVSLSAVSSAAGQATIRKGALDYFLSEETLWTLDAAKVEQRLKPEGFVRSAVSGATTLGEPRDLMLREAHVFHDVPVWSVKLDITTSLNQVILDFFPPLNLALVLSKGDFKNLSNKVQEALNTRLKVKSKPHSTDWQPAEKNFKVTCERWVGKDYQCVFSTLVYEAGTVFRVERCDLKIARTVAPGDVLLTKPLVPTVDRASGIITLEGIPQIPEWPGRHAEWAVLEQALAIAGKRSDRNGIREFSRMGTTWPTGFVPGCDRLFAMAEAKLTPVIPNVFQVEELAKLERACAVAAKKLGKPSPQRILNLVDVTPDVLRAARATPTMVTQFTGALKQALNSGKPLFWVGATSMYPETPAADKPKLGTRLIVGYDTKQDEVIFADAAGLPVAHQKTADAIACAYYVVLVGK